MRTILFIIGTFLAVGSIPFIIDAIRKKDFRDQVSGKKETHPVPESLKQNYDSTSSNPMADQLAQKGIDQVKQDTKSYPL